MLAEDEAPLFHWVEYCVHVEPAGPTQSVRTVPLISTASVAGVKGVQVESHAPKL